MVSGTSSNGGPVTSLPPQTINPEILSSTNDHLNIEMDISGGNKELNVGQGDAGAAGDQKSLPQNFSELNLPDFKKLKAVLEDNRRGEYTIEEEGAIESTRKIVKSYSDEAVRRWNQEIDEILIFDGLFSAVLTTFNVQSYQLLQVSPMDQTNAALAQISLQLSSFSVNPSFLNSTRAAFDPLAYTSAFHPAPSAIALNILWFSSLVFSLASALIGIAVKQWLKEFGSELYGDSPEVARRRQYRLNNLIKWKVPFIIGLLPLLLIISVLLFLAGLIVLLYTINSIVANVIAVLVGTLISFHTLTAVLPTFFKTCCYHCPQSYVVSWTIRGVLWFIATPLYGVSAFVEVLVVILVILLKLPARAAKAPSIFAIAEFMDKFNTWVYRTLITPKKTPHENEHYQATDTSNRMELDADTSIMAYNASLDVNFLNAVEISLSHSGSHDILSTVRQAAQIEHDAPTYASQPKPERKPHDFEHTLRNLFARGLYQVRHTLFSHAPLTEPLTNITSSTSRTFMERISEMNYGASERLLVHFAAVSMDLPEKGTLHTAHMAWKYLFQQLERRKFVVWEPAVRYRGKCKTLPMLISASHRLDRMARTRGRDSFEEPWLYLSDFSPLEWKLHYLYQHLRVIWQLTRFPAENAPRINGEIEATDSVHFDYAMTQLPGILKAIDLENAAPSLVLESDLYNRILGLMVAIAREGDEQSKQLCEQVVEPLVEAFKRLAKRPGGKNTKFQWENPTPTDEGIIRCSNNLIRLHDILKIDHEELQDENRLELEDDDVKRIGL